MFTRDYLLLCLFLIVLPAAPAAAQQHARLTAWITTPDRSLLLAPQQPVAFLSGSVGQGLPSIDIGDKQTMQSIDGFGFALTGGSAQLLMRMDAARRAALLREVFTSKGQGIGVSYLRVSIGSSDMNDHVFTYDDMPPGKEDKELRAFSLAPDRADVLPVLQEIVAINRNIKILASPWSPPAWMKTNGEMKGGSLRREDYDAYALYLVKYIQAMHAEGITIDALTLQNEPLNPNNTPSMKMEAAEQADFLSHSLGPLLKKENLAVKVILYDHNCDVPEYPESILADPAAARYVDGSGFHLYGGEISALTRVHDAYPQKNLYFTEQMVIDKPGDARLAIADPVQRIVIGALANWSRIVLLWNLAADAHNGPHTDDGGCPICEGALTLEGDKVTRNLAYYTIAHASKFITPGSVRVRSSLASNAPLDASLAQVAFKTAAGQYVLIVSNTSNAVQPFAIRFLGKAALVSLPAGSVATYTW